MNECPPLMVAELDVSDIQRSVDFYVSTLGFTIAVDRPERGLAYLTKEGCLDLMLQSADGPGERLHSAPLERPFGRGVSLVIPCRDVDGLLAAVIASGGEVTIPLQERQYRIDVLQPTARWPEVGPRSIVNRQFVVADPDGYLLRFYAERES